MTVIASAHIGAARNKSYLRAKFTTQKTGGNRTWRGR